MRRYIYLIISAIAAIAVVAGCGSTGGGHSATTTSGSTKAYAELTWGMPSFTGAIDWTKNEWYPVTSIEHLAVQNLVELEPNGHIKDGLASSVERPTSTTYVYNLRTGVKFSDGNPLTVADVVYSLRRNLYGKESILKPYWEGVASISTSGTSTVVIKLKRPDAAWPDVMAFTSQIIEKAAAEEAGEHELGMPAHPVIGTGPWKIDSYKPEVGVRLSRNPYWSGPIQLARKIDVELFKEEEPMSLALRSGALDGSFFYMKPKVFANVPGTRSITTQGYNVAYISSKVTVPPFNNVHVRRAIAYATDSNGMINALFPGNAATVPGIVPAGLFADLGSSAEVNAMLEKLPKYTFNLAAAKRELAKSPYPHGFTTTMQAEVAEQPMVLLLQILSADLAKIGIHAKIEELPSDEILSRIEKSSLRSSLPKMQQRMQIQKDYSA